MMRPPHLISDVVQAYKGLLKEKEALENSFKVLSTTKASKEDKVGPTERPTVTESGKGDNDEKDNSFSDPLGNNADQVMRIYRVCLHSCQLTPHLLVTPTKKRYHPRAVITHLGTQKQCVSSPMTRGRLIYSK